MILRALPGVHWPVLVLSKQGKGNPLPSLGGKVDVTFAPAGAPITASAHAQRSDHGEPFLTVSGLPEDFFDRFAGSKEVVVRQEGRELFRIGYGRAAAAIQSLRACDEGLLASWGVDPQLMNSLQRKPVPAGKLSDWVRDADYPDEAIRARQSGSAVVRFTIATDGRARDCVTVASSGSTLLDSQTCRLLTMRARYEPALGPDGKPLAVKAVQTMRWVLPTS